MQVQIANGSVDQMTLYQYDFLEGTHGTESPRPGTAGKNPLLDGADGTARGDRAEFRPAAIRLQIYGRGIGKQIDDALVSGSVLGRCTSWRNWTLPATNPSVDRKTGGLRPVERRGDRCEVRAGIELQQSLAGFGNAVEDSSEPVGRLSMSPGRHGTTRNNGTVLFCQDVSGVLPMGNRSFSHAAVTKVDGLNR